MPIGRLLTIALCCVTLMVPATPEAGASTLLADKNYLEEVNRLEEHIESTAASVGPFSDALFEPLMQLAELLITNGDFETATEHLRSAQNIAHRNDGVYTPRQVQIINMITNMALSDGELKDADRQQRFRFFIETHHLGEADPDRLFAYAELADWYIHTGQTRRARRLLKEAIAMATRLDRNPLPFAVQLNKARRLEGLCCNPSRLLDVLEDTPSSDPDTLAQAYLEIADTLLVGRKDEQAAEYFARAEEVSPLSTSLEPRPIGIRRPIDSLTAVRRQAYRVEDDFFNRTRLDRMTRDEQLADVSVEPQWFLVNADTGSDRGHMGFTIPDIHERGDRTAEPQYLVGNPILFNEEQLDNILPFKLESRKHELRIEVSFTVLENGDLENLEVIETNAPHKLNRLLIDALRKVYYRPALVDGVPVTTHDVRLTQTFDYVSRGI